MFLCLYDMTKMAHFKWLATTFRHEKFIMLALKAFQVQHKNREQKTNKKKTILFGFIAVLRRFKPTKWQTNLMWSWRDLFWSAKSKIVTNSVIHCIINNLQACILSLNLRNCASYLYSDKNSRPIETKENSICVPSRLTREKVNCDL